MTGQAPEILLVEDDPNDADLAMRAIRNATDCVIHLAHDGEEALDVLLHRGSYSKRTSMTQPRLVLLDLKLSKIGGLDVLREMRKHPETWFIPVVMLTSSSQDGDISNSYRSGANSYFQKPVDFSQFRSAIKHVVGYWLQLNLLPRESADARDIYLGRTSDDTPATSPAAVLEADEPGCGYLDLSGGIHGDDPGGRRPADEP